MYLFQLKQYRRCLPQAIGTLPRIVYMVHNNKNKKAANYSHINQTLSKENKITLLLRFLQTLQLSPSQMLVPKIGSVCCRRKIVHVKMFQQIMKSLILKG